MNHHYLSLDIGEKRIGMAVGSVVPFGRGVIEVTNDQQVLDSLKNIVESEQITELVIGIPESAQETHSTSYQLAVSWIEKIKNHFSLPIITVNEAYSSLEAERQLRAEGIDISSAKDKIDERAAMLLLQQYLNESHE